jgi:hypothetical protein
MPLTYCTGVDGSSISRDVSSPEPQVSAQKTGANLGHRAGAETSLGKILMAKGPAMKNFLDALVAVLAGNAIYFLLMPHLPAPVQHRLFKEDLGLLVDFCICTVIFAAVKFARRNDRAEDK